MHKTWFLQGTTTTHALEQTLRNCQEFAGPLRKILLSHSSNSSLPANIYNIFVRYYLDVSFTSSFGYHLNCLTQPDSPVGKSFMKYFPALRFFTMVPSLIYKNVTKNSADIHRSFVQTLMKTETDLIQSADSGDWVSGSEFLKFMLQQREDSKEMTDEQIRGVLHEFMLGAVDTSLVVCNLFWHFMNHPTIADQVRRELASVNPTNDSWSLEKLQLLPYTDQVIYESLRLTPASPVTGRMNAKEDVLGGYTIPAFTNIFFNLEHLHTNPAYWKDPHTFNPDRFAEESEESVVKMSAKWQFAPFGGGARGCAGKRIALILLKATFVAVLPHFDIIFQEKELKRVWEGVRIPINSCDWVTVKERIPAERVAA